MENKFDHFEFLMLCNHYPINLEQVDEMLEGEVDFTHTQFEIDHDFLSELMEYIAEGREIAFYEGNELADDKYMYEVLARIFQKGYHFPNNETIEECLWQLFHANRDEYMLKILDIFQETDEMKRWLLKYRMDKVESIEGIHLSDMSLEIRKQIDGMNFSEYEMKILNAIRFYPDDREVHECDYKERFKELSLEELLYIRENKIFNRLLSLIYDMIEG